MVGFRTVLLCAIGGQLAPWGWLSVLGSLFKKKKKMDSSFWNEKQATMELGLLNLSQAGTFQTGTCVYVCSYS